MKFKKEYFIYKDQVSKLMDILSLKVNNGEITSEQELLDIANKITKITTNNVESYLNNLKELGYYSIITKENFTSITDVSSVLLIDQINNINYLNDILISFYNEMLSKIEHTKYLTDSLKTSLNTAKLYTNDLYNEYSVKYYDFSNITQVSNNAVNEISFLSIDLNKKVLTLPIKEEKDITNKIKNISIIGESNGTPGNNYDITSAINNNINSLIDNNIKTIFEYEKINSKDELRLILLFEFNDPVILNKISFVPINFGTVNWPYIINMSYSIDGDKYNPIEVAEKYPIELTISKTENINNTEVYFKPIECKYISITLIMNDEYPIYNSLGIQKMRKAIAFKDIIFSSIKYINNGSIYLQPITSDTNIKQIMHSLDVLFDEEYFVDSGDYKMEISLNDEYNLYKINPIESTISDGNSPEILYFNNYTVPESINTEENVKKIIPKLTLKLSNKITQTLDKTKDVEEILLFPTSAPYVLPLSNIPIASTVNIFNPYHIGIGKSKRLVIKPSGEKVAQPEYTQIYKIDILNIPKYSETIFVNGEKWERVDMITTSMPPTAHVYTINYETKEIKFGLENPSGDSFGGVPTEDDTIEMVLSKEKILLNDISDIINIELALYPTTYNVEDKDKFELYNLNGVETILENVLITNNIIKINKDIVKDSFQFLNINMSEVNFINGNIELSSQNTFSIDYINGIIYLSNYIGDSTQVEYSYYKKTIIDKEYYSINGNKLSLSINSVIFNTITEIDSFSITSNTKTINLPDNSIVPKSILYSVSGIDIDNFMTTEIPFINGVDEFDIYEKITYTFSTNDTIQYLPYSIFEDELHKISFDNETFFNDSYRKYNLNDIYNSPFAYYIDLDNGIIYTNNFSNIKGTSITYYKLKEDFDPNSVFSVDYANGIIYLYSGRDTETYVTIREYKTCSLYAEYIASDKINENDYIIEEGNMSVIFTNYNLIDKISNYNIPILIQYKTVVQSNTTDEKLLPYKTPFINNITFKYIED